MPSTQDQIFNKWLKAKGIKADACRGGRCVAGKLCDHCQAYEDLKKLHWEKCEKHAPLLRQLQNLAEVFPEEMRELLAPHVVHIMEIYLEET